MKFLKGCLSIVGGFVVLLILIGVIFGNKNSSTNTTNLADTKLTNTASDLSDAKSRKETKPETKGGVTMANYKKLENGMSYREVVAILGKEGEEMSSNEVAGIKSAMYKWDGDGGGFGANMNAMFQNGKMMSKAQLNLK
jgi:Domain of Unknown Function with PDB structure (DUF3862)